MDLVPTDGIDLTTISGIVIITVALVQFLKRLPWFRDLALEGKEALATVVLAVALGLGSKFSGIGFVDQPTLQVTLSIAVAVIGSGATYKHLVKPGGTAMKKRNGAAGEL